MTLRIERTWAAGREVIRLTGRMQAEFLAAYRKREWDSAESVMKRTRAHLRGLGISGLDSYYDLFASRVADFRSKPPPADWDGAFTALEK